MLKEDDNLVIDNLILVVSPINLNSKLMDELKSQERIKRIIYIEMEGDPITGVADGQITPSLFKAPGIAASVVFDGGVTHNAHIKVTWSDDLPKKLAGLLVDEYNIHKKQSNSKQVFEHKVIPKKEWQRTDGGTGWMRFMNKFNDSFMEGLERMGKQ